MEVQLPTSAFSGRHSWWWVSTSWKQSNQKGQEQLVHWPQSPKRRCTKEQPAEGHLPGWYLAWCINQSKKAGDEGSPQHPYKVLRALANIITVHLVLVIRGLPCKKAKVEFSHLRISVNINVQICMYYLKQHSCSLTVSLSTSYQIPFSWVIRKAEKFCNRWWAV